MQALNYDFQVSSIRDLSFEELDFIAGADGEITVQGAVASTLAGAAAGFISGCITGPGVAISTFGGAVAGLGGYVVYGAAMSVMSYGNA